MVARFLVICVHVNWEYYETMYILLVTGRERIISLVRKGKERNR